MNQKQAEYIALYSLVFGAILLIGVLARQYVLTKGIDEFSATVAFFATVIVMSALYASIQISVNNFLLPCIDRLMFRFSTPQKSEDIEGEAEEISSDTPLQQSEYDMLKSKAIAEKESAAQSKLNKVLDYTKNTLVSYMSEDDLNRLCTYISEYSTGDTLPQVSPVTVDSQLKTIDIMHFGWNIGKAFRKQRIHTATFLKEVFAHALRDSEITTIERKMSHTESGCIIKLEKQYV